MYPSKPISRSFARELLQAAHEDQHRLVDFRSLPTQFLNSALAPGDFFETDYAKHLLKLPRRVWLRILDHLPGILGADIFLRPRGLLGRESAEFWLPLALAAELKTKKIIAGIERLPAISDEPKLFRYLAQIEDSEASRTARNPNGLGVSLRSESEAMLIAVAEAYERSCFILYMPEYRLETSYRQIRNTALPIFSLAGLSEEDRRKGHPRYNLDVNERTIFRWVKGFSLTQSRPQWLPLQLVTLNYDFFRREPVLRLPISTGSAVGFSLENALINGILEIVERDAFMITYLKRLTPQRLDLTEIATAVPELRAIIESCIHHNLQLSIVRLPTDVPCHVILAVVHGPAGSPSLALGAKANLDLAQAVRGAVCEAISSRIFLAETLPRIPPSDIPKVSEPERIDRLERLYIWANQPELMESILFLFSGPILRWSDVKPYSHHTAREAMRHLMTFFRKEKIEVSYVLNAPEGKSIESLTSVKVIIPTFQPMHLIESLPYFSGARLTEIPRKLGYAVDASINRIPHPFP